MYFTPVRKLLLFVTSAVIALIPCELMVRLSGYRPKIIDSRMFQSHPDVLLPYKLRPNYDGYYVGGSVHTDADGNRLVLPQCSGRRVVILGDSVAFGQGLDDDATLSSQLQKESCGRYQIRSLAVPGYSSWNEYGAFRDYREPVDRLILIYVPNDITYENNHLKITGDEIADISKNRAQKLLRALYSRVYVSSLMADSIKRLRHRESTIASTSDPNMLEYSLHAVQLISELCKQRNTEFSVAIYRDLWHYNQPVLSARYEEALIRSLNDRGIHNFVLKSHIENLEIQNARIYFNDPHPSKMAVEFMAADIKPYL
jgi:hypothetical protein